MGEPPSAASAVTGWGGGGKLGTRRGRRVLGSLLPRPGASTASSRRAALGRCAHGAKWHLGPRARKFFSVFSSLLGSVTKRTGFGLRTSEIIFSESFIILKNLFESDLYMTSSTSFLLI